MYLCYTYSPSESQDAHAFQKYPGNEAPTFGTQGLLQTTSVVPTRLTHHTSILSGNKESGCSMQNARHCAIQHRTCQPHLPAEFTLHMCCSSCRRHLQRHINFTDNAPTSQPLHAHFDDSLKSHKAGWGWKPTGSFYGKV